MVRAMRCHVCNAEVGEGQRFCHECGESLGGVTDPTEALDMDAMFEQADADGASIGGSLSWSDGDGPEEGAADGEATEDDDATVVAAVGATAISATLPTEPIEEAPPAAGGADELWGSPTGEQQAVAPVDPNATTAMAAQPAPVDEAAASEATTTVAAVGAAGATTDPYEATAPYGAGTTDEIPNQIFDGGADAVAFAPATEPPRVRLTLVLALLTVLTAVLASFADVTDVRTDRVVPGIENRLRTLDDIGSNLAVAVILGAAAMLLGGVLHCFNSRWGAGLAGGAGLALAGWAAVTIGLAEVPIHTAERITRDPNTPGPFILTVTRDLGYWLIVAVGALGLIACVFSLVSAGNDGRAGLNPWTAAVGALGGVIAAAGPLIPTGGESFSVNFGVDGPPTALFAGRLVQVGLLGVGVMVGFLLVRRYGLGLVAGSLSVPTWMWITTLADVGDAPVGVGVGNIGTVDVTPHAVTTVGMVISLFMLAIAATLATVQRNR